MNSTIYNAFEILYKTDMIYNDKSKTKNTLKSFFTSCKNKYIAKIIYLKNKSLLATRRKSAQ